MPQSLGFSIQNIQKETTAIRTKDGSINIRAANSLTDWVTSCTLVQDGISFISCNELGMGFSCYLVVVCLATRLQSLPQHLFFAHKYCEVWLIAYKTIADCIRRLLPKISAYHHLGQCHSELCRVPGILIGDCGFWAMAVTARHIYHYRAGKSWPTCKGLLILIKLFKTNWPVPCVCLNHNTDIYSAAHVTLDIIWLTTETLLQIDTCHLNSPNFSGQCTFVCAMYFNTTIIRG